MNATRILLAGLSAALLLVGCEKPPPETVQRGTRGTGMVQVYNPSTLAADAPRHQAPEEPPAASAEGPKAGQVYQNVKVLGHLSVAEFARVMTMMTNSVAPKQGCVHCHAAANFADDSMYTKVVARRMLQMTQSINEKWKSHVGQTGVTCYTCHRGANVPSEVWFKPLQDAYANGFAGDRAGQNQPASTTALTALPVDPFTPFLLEAQDIRVGGDMALPAGNRQSTKQAEWTYALMMHMSKSLNVNCTQCHNSRSFSSWGGESSPPRLTAWHGIRMTRELNTDYLVPLTEAFPAHRLGALGDVAKVNCATCHQGAHKPLFGAPMAANYPELMRKPELPASASADGKLSSEELQSASALVPKAAVAAVATPP